MVDPIPSEPRRASLSSGEWENELVVGDMRPNRSSGDVSADGWSALIANSAERGEMGEASLSEGGDVASGIVEMAGSWMADIVCGSNSID